MTAFDPPPPPQGQRRVLVAANPSLARWRRRVLVLLVAAWVLALIGAGAWYSQHGHPTVRDQTTVDEARPYVDAGSGAVLVAAGIARAPGATAAPSGPGASGGPVPVIEGYERVGGCRLTPVRVGDRYARVVAFVVPPGTEVTLLRRIAAGLPKRYRAGVAGHSLVADAGYYVLVTGEVARPGLVRVTLDTGCRAAGATPAPDASPADAAHAAVVAVLARLRASTAQPSAMESSLVRWSTYALPCGVGTVTAVAPIDGATSLRAVLGSSDGSVVADDDLYAFVEPKAAVADHRDANRVAVAVIRDGNQVSVAATTGTCRSSG